MMSGSFALLPAGVVGSESHQGFLGHDRNLEVIHLLMRHPAAAWPALFALNRPRNFMPRSRRELASVQDAEDTS